MFPFLFSTTVSEKHYFLEIPGSHGSKNLFLVHSYTWVSALVGMAFCETSCLEWGTVGLGFSSVSPGGCGNENSGLLGSVMDSEHEPVFLGFLFHLVFSLFLIVLSTYLPISKF